MCILPLCLGGAALTVSVDFSPNLYKECYLCILIYRHNFHLPNSFDDDNLFFVKIKRNGGKKSC